ncbi:hypothetical protein HPB48_004672 [Haemaphysalis longicornis]|uniref:Uncharacterized protein n=1 Tax=Haemaphysalis longicornis TaxID=44386 RepID=A0A9J6G0B2_HAELO|nr:hypothetical protein HPB48_004672 [Haemaphysalis longicornis]
MLQVRQIQPHPRYLSSRHPLRTLRRRSRSSRLQRNPLKCANCQTGSQVLLPYCPRWQEEKKVLMDGSGKKIPKKQARFELSATKEDNRRTANNGCTYAQALDKTPNPAQPALIQQASPSSPRSVPVDPAISSMLSTAIETLASAIEIFKQHVRAT